MSKEEIESLPKWLTANLLETAIKTNFSVKSLRLVNATAPGENYVCIVHRAVADTSLGPIPLIIKSMPESEFRAQFVREAELTTKEIRMYQHTLPLLKGELNKPNTALCYHTIEDGVRDTLILQDLGPLGFRTRNRRLGFDFAHCRLALTELAHLHGLSAALRIQKPDVFAKEMAFYKDTIYVEEKRENTAAFLNNIFRVLSEALRNQLPYRFHTLTRIMNFIGKHAFDDLKLILNPEESVKVQVLNHGDFWCNNMLFQYKEGSEEPLSCVPIDFQASRRASPTLDLQYFLYSSTTQATRRAHLDELLKLYLDETRWMMKQKGVEEPDKAFYSSLDELKEDMKRNALGGFVTSCFVLGAVTVESENVVDMDQLDEKSLTEGDDFGKMYAGPLFRDRFAGLLEDFDDMGLFSDYLKKYPNADQYLVD